ncbi:EGF domain-specific O-linked N-acetylglucosamine transferase [Musca domestica]|uniref:EGF domain-specific O-linked N-acetylglucosamine transferase n=1 Tax=Musca domestica TaxID=7370 RepID=A0A1I8MYS6_MUSDO|nr:EGF domain-specific O-linked N-acetylglucosamine transferase [Musca domestica]
MEKFLLLSITVTGIVVLWPLLCLCECDVEQSLSLPDLPLEHLKRYINTFDKVKQQYQNKTELLQKIVQKDNKGCWGHEPDCAKENRFQTPICPGSHTGWVRNKESQVETFYEQADFGYIKHQIKEMKLMCEPKLITDSSLECTEYMRFCRGRYLMLDFRDLPKRQERIRYHMDVLKEGQIQGYCQLNETRLKSQLDHMGALQSWSPELRNFIESKEPISESSEQCDMFINTPTFLMKIDATYNMYHHFCDFFNLYATLFVNQTHSSVFDRNTQVIVWETYPYDSPFRDTFKAFSTNPVWTLDQVKGKRICFRNVVFPLLPRMIFGLYYNTPIIQGCEKSGLFRAFSEFILHRLKVPFVAPKNNKIRITFLSRRTKYRRVKNEEELLEEISKNEDYIVQKISYERELTFLQQLEVTRNTDILIGMHGAGLTHLLFLPEWASLFELYNCEDPNCYKDLARLRGINYITWEERDLVYPEDEGHHPEGGAHAKFTNYAFDAKEFARLVDKAAEHVKAHVDFQKYNQEALTKDEL